MKLLRLFSFIFFITYYSANTAAQTLPSTTLFIENKSSKLKVATGWQQAENGNWISNVNAISDVKLSEQMRNTVPQYFKWMQIISLQYSGDTMYALLYENSSNISDNKIERHVYYYMMDIKSYSDLVDVINKKNGQELIVHSSIYGYMSDDNSEFSADRLLKLINESITNENPIQYDFILSAQYIDNRDIVRFRLPERSSIMRGNLNKSYFEVDLNDFVQILLPVNSAQSDDSDLSRTSSSDVNIMQNTLLSQQVDSIDNWDERSHDVSEPLNGDSKVLSENNNRLGNIALDNSLSENNGDEFGNRINKQRAIVSEPIAYLSKIEGWYYTDEGEWVGSNSPSYKFETVGKYDMRNFSYRNIDYILITKHEKYAGASYLLFKKEDYVREIANLDLLSIIKIPVVAYAGIGNKLEDMVEISEKAIDAPKKENIYIFKEYKMALQYKISRTKNLARFFIFGLDCSRYGSEVSAENCDSKVSNKISYKDAALLLTNDLLKKMYYETSYTEFIDFIQKPLSRSEIGKSRNTDF